MSKTVSGINVDQLSRRSVIVMPPLELADCLKEDLSNFLIDNSFNHLLGPEDVPVHVVHGTADTLVPYQQALNLCGEIDNRVLATGVVDPLTTYSCGTASQIQIVKDAEHALELGVCLGTMCPAGATGSPSRDAVAKALEGAFQWLMDDPPAADPDPPVVNQDPPKSGGGAFNWVFLFVLLLLYRRRVSAETF